MGFKKINQNELNTSFNSSLIGMPSRQVQISKDLVGIETRPEHDKYSIEKVTEISISNEEVMEFQYFNDGKRKSIQGSGTLSIFNNSNKDRIWDARLQFSGSKFCNLESKNNMNLGILEPKSNKSINYDIINMDQFPDYIKVYEEIEVLNDKISESDNFEHKLKLSEEEPFNDNLKKNHLFVLGKENMIKFFITIENNSTSILRDIEIKKSLSRKFYDIKFEIKTHKNVKSIENVIEWVISEIQPKEKVQLIILAKCLPKKIELIRTGKIEISYLVNDNIISDVKIEDFSAYSHAFHEINTTEIDNKPNYWNCAFNFENHSEFLLELKSIQISEVSKSNKYLDLDFGALGKKPIIQPGGSYTTEEWEINNENNPTFSRKIEYSVVYNFEKKAVIKIEIDDNNFEIADVQIKKVIPEGEIKSFEESIINNTIIIKNNGSVPISGIVIKETIPGDFLPPLNGSSYKLKSSSGDIEEKYYIIEMNPNDDDLSKEHILEIKVNLNNHQLKNVINQNETLELIYPLKAISPDYKKAYKFPVEIDTYYRKFQDQEESHKNEYYIIKDIISLQESPSVNVSHKRRKLTIGKEIFPGRSSDEFAINILIKNRSNSQVNDINISDMFPDSFEFISSNLDHKLIKDEKQRKNTIFFSVDKILPYQEKEILYYLKNVSGKDVDYSELESIFNG